VREEAILRWLKPRHDAQLQLLREQIRILCARVDAERDSALVLERVKGHKPPEARRAIRTGQRPETLVWMRAGTPVGLSAPT
jgi:hypothetical protein